MSYVCPAKYRRAVIMEDVDKELREICLGMEARCETEFLEIRTERGHVYFLAQSAPTRSPERIVRTIESVTARKIFERCPETKRRSWGGNSGQEAIMCGERGGTRG
ncbi:MAG: IS200/IS605 family transposase [Treponema sp.]|nr:IS200/IS605 family transposase [Treponema sp.]